MNRKLYNPHPDHSRNCMTIRAAGWDWCRRRREWFHAEARIAFATAWLAYDWCVYEGVELS